MGPFGGGSARRIIRLGRDPSDRARTAHPTRATAPLVWYLRMRELERDPTDSFDAAALRAPLAVVGAGRAGRSLARAALDAGPRRRARRAPRRRRRRRERRIALLCVPDAAIAQACETIAAAIPPLRFVGHVSGATPLTALAAARRRGAEVFCIHPLQTDSRRRHRASPARRARSRARAREARRSRASWRRGSACAPSRSPTTQRTAYHAAACMASNFLVALEESAAELLERAGSRTRGSCWPRSCCGPPPTGPSAAARR